MPIDEYGRSVGNRDVADRLLDGGYTRNNHIQQGEQVEDVEAFVRRLMNRGGQNGTITPPTSSTLTIVLQILTAIFLLGYGVASYYLLSGFWHILGAWIVGGGLMLSLWSFNKDSDESFTTMIGLGGGFAFVTAGFPIVWTLLDDFIPVLLAWVGCILIACLMFAFKAMPRIVRIIFASICIAFAGAFIWTERVPAAIYGLFDVEYTKQAEPSKPTEQSKSPRIDYEDGSYYIGAVKDGKRHGQGEMFYKDGDRYEGEWKENKWHGRGSYYNAKAKRTSIGQYDNGVNKGQFTVKWESGDRYEGTWSVGSDNFMQGEGTYFYAKGTSEKGKWVKGKWIKASEQNTPASGTDSGSQQKAEQKTSSSGTDSGSQKDVTNILRRANTAFQNGIATGNNAEFQKAYELYLQSDKSAGYKKFKTRADQFLDDGLDDEYQFFIKYANKLK
ncbi:MAG: hypothetical protein LBD59_12520 [Prevotellaceae bacterium]|jgi:hypothetical protein|nr:hypothetical protein [Prevotellaceae bacterium]